MTVLYFCNKGKIGKKSDGDAMDYEDIGEACVKAMICDCGNCDGACGGGCCDNCNCATPKQDALFDELDQPIRRFNESYVRELENKLQAGT